MLVMSCGDVKSAADIGVANSFITCSGGSAGAKIIGIMGWIAAGMAARTLAAGNFGAEAAMLDIGVETSFITCSAGSAGTKI